MIGNHYEDRAARSSARPALWLSLAAVVVLGAGCASLDATQVELARATVATASEDPNVDAATSLHLEEAKRHLELAEEALDDGSWQEVTDHEAYMAKTLAEVAMVDGEARALSDSASGALRQARAETRSTQAKVEAAVRRARALQARETERGLVLTLGGVLFEFDSAVLKPEALLATARVAGFLIASDDRETLVEGYTDSQGSEDYNLELSLRRAQAVRAALIESGVEGSRIAAAGHGPSYPVADNDTAEGRASNRRVEILILNPGESAAMALRAR